MPSPVQKLSPISPYIVISSVLLAAASTRLLTNGGVFIGDLGKRLVRYWWRGGGSGKGFGIGGQDCPVAIRSSRRLISRLDGYIPKAARIHSKMRTTFPPFA